MAQPKNKVAVRTLIERLQILTGKKIVLEQQEKTFNSITQLTNAFKARDFHPGAEDAFQVGGVAYQLDSVAPADFSMAALLKAKNQPAEVIYANSENLAKPIKFSYKITDGLIFPIKVETLS